MQFYLISDNVDTQMGMRLAGIEGVVVHEPDEVKKALDDAMKMPDVEVVLMMDKLVDLCDSYVYEIKFKMKRPLIVEIPDRHATFSISDSISRYVRDAIGVSI